MQGSNEGVGLACLLLFSLLIINLKHRGQVRKLFLKSDLLKILIVFYKFSL
jgi:hypothetical protein